jgi:drug/metabolite transporter (DMT)-like permease
MSDNREAYSKMFLNFAFGFLYILILNLTTGSFRLPALQGLAGTIYIGIFEMGLTFVLWLTALKLSATTANVSNLVYISPFLSLILISFLVGEEIKLATVVGLIIIVGGIFLQQWSYLRNPGKKHTSIDP